MCNSLDREQIEAGIAAKTPYRTLAKTFGVSLGSISRHAHHCDELGGPQDAAGSLEAIDEQLRELRVLQLRARRKGDPELTLLASRELRALIELRERLASRQPARRQEQAELDAALDDDQVAAMAAQLLEERKQKKQGKVN